MMSEFSKSLTRVGLHPEDGDRNNLRQLLKLYQEKEEELQRIESNQKRELKGVENYIESIRKVSDERDAITEELESENEALKDEIRQLRQELNGRNHEIKEVLKQGGLVDLAEGSPGEAVAYLMIERSRLMDDINQLKKLNETTSVDEVKDHLAKEIKLLKDELVEEKLKFGIKEDKLKMDLKAQTAQAEILKDKALQDSKEKEKKIKDLEGEVKKLKLSLIIEKKRKKNEDPAKNAKGHTQQKSLSGIGESKIPILKVGKTGVTNNDNESTRVKELTAALETEKKRKSSYEATIIKLKTLQDKNKKEIADLQHNNKELEKENQSLEERLNRTREQALSIQNEGLKEDSRSVAQLYRELEQLRRQNDTSSAKLQMTMNYLEDERKKCGRLEQTLKETEKKWEGVVDRYKTNEQDLQKKLNQLNKELERAKDDMAASHREIMKLKGEQERVMDSNKSESHQLHREILREQEQVRELKRQLERAGKMEAKVEDLKKDRDVLAKELQVMIAKENTNQVSATSVEVLRNENKSLKDELSESHKRQSDLYEDLTKLQSKHREITLELTSAAEKLRTSDETIHFLRGELGRKSKELIDTFDFSREGQSKIELEVVNLQRNIDEERRSFTKDNCDLKLRFEVEEKKNEDLNRVLKEKTEEIANLRREVGRLSLSSTRLDERLQEELKQRQTVDSRNKVLEEELAKLWSQLKEVMDKHAANELSKTELEGELFRIPELQEELDTTLLKLETAQSHANELAVSTKEAKMLKEDLIKIKLQLQEEKVQSSMIAKQLEDSLEHLKIAEERKRHLEEMNSKLKHQLLTVQSELTTIEDKHKNIEDLHLISEQGKQALQQSAVTLQGEVTRLQMKLSQTVNQLDNQNKKYMNLKLQTKEKMENARDIFNRHKAVLVENIQQVQNELNRVKGDLEKERSFKDDIKKKNETLLNDNRQLMDKMADREESLSDQGRNISSLEYRTKFLEQENGMLQDRISSLTRQRMALEKVVREFRMEKQKEDIYKAIGSTPSGQPLTSPSVIGPGLGIQKTPYSSGLGNSVSNSIISGSNINRPGVGLLMETSTPSTAPRINGFSIGVNGDSPRLGGESDGMSADTEGR